MAGPAKPTARPVKQRPGEKAFASIAIALIVLSAGLLLSLLLTSGGEAGFGGSRDRDDHDHDAAGPHDEHGMDHDDEHADHDEEHTDAAPRQRPVFFTGQTLVLLTAGYLALLALWAGVLGLRSRGKEER